MTAPHEPAPDASVAGSPLLAGLIQDLQAHRPGRATGPRTLRGKRTSRANATTHGLRCQVVAPPDDRPKIEARTAAWVADLRPDGEAQTWLVGRAAAISVRLDRCLEREQLALAENTAEAERTWLKKRRAWARRLGNRLVEQPVKAFAKLLTSALGIDWLLARWEELASDLEDEMGCWCQEERERAVRLLGLSLRDTAADDPRFRPLWVNALATDYDVTPAELDWTFKRDTSHLEGAERVAEARKLLPDEPTARKSLLAIVRKEQEELRALRARLWESVDRPALEAACQRARTFDPSGEASLARRYESANALELSRCLNLLARLKREAARHAENEAAPPTASPWSAAETHTTAAPAFEAIHASQAPNELENGKDCDANDCGEATCDVETEAPRASQGRPEGVARMSRAQRRRALKEAHRRRNRR